MRAGARQGISLSVSSGMRGVGAAVSARGRTGNNRSAGGRGTCRKGCLTIRERCSRSVKGRRGREWFLVLPTGRSSGGDRDVSLSGREMPLRGLSPYRCYRQSPRFFFACFLFLFHGFFLIGLIVCSPVSHNKEWRGNY